MKTVTLNNGVEMPILGFGVFQVPPQECEAAVLNAFEAGYRMIDTAQAYYNEEGVGHALKACGLPRKDVFLVTKVWLTNAGEEKAAKSIDESLEKLQSDYIDLLLIHQPFSDYVGTWRAMEHAVNVFSQQWDAQAEMKPYGTRLMAWGPLAQGNPELQDHPLMQRLASKYGKTPQQVALRYLVERDIIAIPKTTHFDRMKQNLDVFDFELTSEEMQSLRALDRPIDFRWSHRNPELVRFLWNYDKNFNPKNQAE